MTRRRKQIKICIYGTLFLIYGLLLVRKKTNHAYKAFLDDYAADLLCVPLVLATSSVVLQYLYQKEIEHRVWQVFLVAAYISLFFELFLPKISSKYTGDWVDIICYFTGAIFYLLVENIIDHQKVKSFFENRN